MPGKGWNSILDLALSLAGLEASNEGIGTEASLGDALKVNFPKQVEEAKRIIAKEQGVRAIQWKEFAVSSLSEAEAIQDKLSSKPESLWKRYKDTLSFGRKYTGYYAEWMTHSVNHSVPSGQQKKECLLSVLKKAKAAEVMEAALRKLKYKRKKQEKQEKHACAAGGGGTPQDVPAAPQAKPAAPNLPAAPQAKPAAPNFARKGPGARLSSGSTGVAVVNSPAVDSPAPAASPGMLQRLARAASATMASVLSPSKSQPDEPSDDDDDDGDEDNEGEGEGEGDSVPLHQQVAKDDEEVDASYTPFAWYFWLSKGPFGDNIEELQYVAGGEEHTTGKKNAFHRGAGNKTQQRALPFSKARKLRVI